MDRYTKHIFYGVLAGLGLLMVYVIIMGLGTGSVSFTISELIRLKYWITAIIVGFGLQMALFSYAKACQGTRIGNGMTTTSTATSTGAMVACCAHHLTDILPFLGLSAAATFLSTYQTWFLALAIFSNLVGIIIILKQLERVKAIDLGRVKNVAVVLLIVLVGIWGTLVLYKPVNKGQTSQSLETRTDSQGAVEVEVKPQQVSAGRQAIFEVSFNTHSVNMDYDFAKISKLTDNQGNEYQAVSWNGGKGGHHISGTLTFPQLSTGIKSVELNIIGVGGYDRKFKWEI